MTKIIGDKYIIQEYNLKDFKKFNFIDNETKVFNFANNKNIIVIDQLTTDYSILIVDEPFTLYNNGYCNTWTSDNNLIIQTKSNKVFCIDNEPVKYTYEELIEYLTLNEIEKNIINKLTQYIKKYNINIILLTQ